MGASLKPKLITGFQKIESIIGYIISLSGVLNRVSFQSRRLKQGVNFGGVRSTCVTKFFKVI